MRIELVNTPGVYKRAYRLIERFQKRNLLSFKVEIKFNFNSKFLGFVRVDKHPEDTNIYINPLNFDENDPVRIGHPEDYSLFSVLIHEYAHLINHKTDLIKQYRKAGFSNQHCYLTPQSSDNYDEELADILCIYIINPYCLGLIDNERFEWVKERFHSPNQCSEKRFYTYFHSWDKKTRDRFVKKNNLTK